MSSNEVDDVNILEASSIDSLHIEEIVSGEMEEIPDNTSAYDDLGEIQDHDNDLGEIQDHDNDLGDIQDHEDGLGEIQDQEVEDIPTFDPLAPPSAEHLWNALSGGWIHQEEIPEDQRSRWWLAYKENVLLCTGQDTVIIPDAYLHPPHHNSDQYEQIGLRNEYPRDPMMMESSSSTSSFRNDSMMEGQPQLARSSLSVAPTDMSDLSRPQPLSSVELQTAYKQVLIGIFRSNHKELSHRMIHDTFLGTVNTANREALVNMWYVDWNQQKSQETDDRFIKSHAYHQGLEGEDLQIFARLMHKYCLTNSRASVTPRQVLSNDITLHAVSQMIQKCIMHNIPMLLRDTMIIDCGAIEVMQQQARAIKHTNLALRGDPKPGFEDPCTWPNHHYIDYFKGIYPDKASKGASLTDHQAQRFAKEFCYHMETISHVEITTLVKTISDALRNKLFAIAPDAIYKGRQTHELVVTTIISTLQLMAQKPSEYKMASEFVDQWKHGQIPTDLQEIEKFYIDKFTEVAIYVEKLQKHLQGRKRQILINASSATVLADSQVPNRSEVFKRQKTNNAQQASIITQNKVKVANTTKICPTCGNLHNKDAKKLSADGQCKFLGHPEANKETLASGQRIPWKDSDVGKRYASANKTHLTWAKDINDNVVGMAETNLSSSSNTSGMNSTSGSGSSKNQSGR